jgi:predicted dehydrogenase
MFDALRNGTPLHCTGQQALHILDICLTILESAEEGRAKSLTTTFAPSPPMCA